LLHNFTPQHYANIFTMDQQPGNQLNIEISEEVAEGSYANLAIITHSNAEFVIDFVKSDDITTDDLKEFAEKMNIELTKEIEVTFKVDVKFTATVPLDFDVDKIDESDFDVRVDYRGNDDDIEMNEEYVDTEDFEVSEDN